MSRTGAGPEILVGTRNPGKLRELRLLFAPLGRPLVDLRDLGIAATPDEELVESEATFAGNALAKARFFARRAGGRAVLADDSGLAVAALGGAPGVRSRRYAGAVGDESTVTAANSAKLLEELRGVEERAAAFVCAVAFVDGEREIVCEGRADGRILTQPAGTDGFGYDPLFWSADLGMTFAEASAREKARVSHRARAAAALIAELAGAAAGAA